VIDSTLCGVGMTLEPADPWPGCFCYVASIKHGGAAHQSGRVLVGDQLVRIDGFDCVGQARHEIKRRVIGPEGTEIVLEFKRAGQDTFEARLLRTVEAQQSPVPAAARLPDSRSPRGDEDGGGGCLPQFDNLLQTMSVHAGAGLVANGHVVAITRPRRECRNARAGARQGDITENTSEISNTSALPTTRIQGRTVGDTSILSSGDAISLEAQSTGSDLPLGVRVSLDSDCPLPELGMPQPDEQGERTCICALLHKLKGTVNFRLFMMSAVLFITMSVVVGVLVSIGARSSQSPQEGGAPDISKGDTEAAPAKGSMKGSTNTSPINWTVEHTAIVVVLIVLLLFIWGNLVLEANRRQLRGIEMCRNKELIERAMGNRPWYVVHANSRCMHILQVLIDTPGIATQKKIVDSADDAQPKLPSTRIAPR
jgi:hypothetical protein